MGRNAIQAADQALLTSFDLLIAATADGRLSVDDLGLATMQLKSLLKGLLFWPLVIDNAKRPTKTRVNAVVQGAVRMFLDHYEK